MADRADYLARALIARLSNLQASLAEDGRREADRSQRIQAIEKIMAVEFGITDGNTMALIEAALPNLNVSRQTPDQDLVALANFLRRHLGAQLAAS